MPWTPPPVPTVPDADRVVTYTPVASAGPFVVPFTIWGAADDLFVTLDGDWQNSGWTLASPSGLTAPTPITDGEITFSGPATGTLIIEGRRKPRRTSNVVEGQDNARSRNLDLNAIVATMREIWTRFSASQGLSITGNTLDLQGARGVNAADGIDLTDLVTVQQLDGISVAAGNVPTPGASFAGKILAALSATTWGWVPGVAIPDASDTVKGIAELATNAETVTGTDAVRTVTPAGLAASALRRALNFSDVASAATAFANIKQAATSAVTGVVELATPGEVVTGTDTTRAATAEGVAAAIAAVALPAYGELRSYVFAYSTAGKVFGTTYAGSTLKPSGISGATLAYTTSASVLAGTWVCLGQNNSAANVTLFQRIA